jgi:hypothetical protein
MPTAYKGKIRITCKVGACWNDPARADVGSDCIGCADSRSDILDLEDRTLAGIGRRVDPEPEILPEIDQVDEPEQGPDVISEIDKQEKPAAKRLKLIKKED